MNLEICNHCTFEIPLDCRHCPHCCYGLQCPNVRKANDPAEKQALERRYRFAVVDAAARGASTVVQEFQNRVLAAKVVMGIPIKKLLPIANRSQDLFASYYDLMELKFLSQSSGPIDFNTRRPQAEIELMGTHKHLREIYYACLSIDGNSLPHYEECTVWLAEKMISHRASLLSENSAVAYHRDHELTLGHRAIWPDRAKLCVAKLASALSPAVQSSQFAKLLMNPGPTAIDDEFVEVQVLGDMTIRTAERVEIRSPKTNNPSNAKRSRSRRGSKDEILIRDYCGQQGVPCEIM